MHRISLRRWLTSTALAVFGVMFCMIPIFGFCALFVAPAEAADQPEALRQLSKPELQRQLIMAGVIEAEVGLASLADMRCTVQSVRTGDAPDGCGGDNNEIRSPLNDEELRWLGEVETAFLDAFVLQPVAFPAIDMQVLVPTALIDGPPASLPLKPGWMVLGNPKTAMEIEVFRLKTISDTPASLLVGNIGTWRNINTQFTQLTPDEIWSEGDGVQKRSEGHDRCSDSDLQLPPSGKPESDKAATDKVGEPQCQKYVFRNRYMRGRDNVFGVFLKAVDKLTEAEAASILTRLPKLAALLEKLESPPRSALKPAQTIATGRSVAEVLQGRWRQIFNSLTNLIMSRLAADTAGGEFDASSCATPANPSGSDRGNETHTPQIVVFGTDRQRAAKLPIVDLTKIFGTAAGGELSLGCATILVPNSTEGRQRQEMVQASPVGKPGGQLAEDKTYITAAQLAPSIQASRNGLRARMWGHSNTLGNGKRALLYVHGFNNSFADALGTAALIKAQSNYTGPIFAFSWPSNERPKAYFDDLDRSEQSEAYLRAFLVSILRDADISRLDIVAHSMGSQLVLRVLDSLGTLLDRRLQPDEDTDRFRFGQIIFAAPDVNAQVFRERIGGIAGFANRVTVYASSTDLAMKLSAEARGTQSRAGGIQANGDPIMPGLANVHMIDVSNSASEQKWFQTIRCFILSDCGHNPHLIKKQVVDDIKLILLGQRTARNARRTDESTETLEPHRRNTAMVRTHHKDHPSMFFWRFQR
jgi:esterase/lipase superfamily enzyme